MVIVYFFCNKTMHIQQIIWKLSHAQQRQSAILGALKQLNLLDQATKFYILKSWSSKVVSIFLVDAMLQKVVYSKKNQEPVCFLAVCMYHMVIIKVHCYNTLFYTFLYSLSPVQSVLSKYNFNCSVRIELTWQLRNV